MSWVPRHLSSRQLTIASLAASLSVLLMTAAIAAWFDLAALESTPITQPVSYTGVLHRDRVRIRVQPVAGPAFDCPTSVCGYRGARAHHGKVVSVTTAGGRILEVVVDGERRNVHAEAIQSEQDTVLGAAIGVLISAVVVAVILLRGRRRN
jgi:hypothetical protein